MKSKQSNNIIQKKTLYEINSNCNNKLDFQVTQKRKSTHPNLQRAFATIHDVHMLHSHLMLNPLSNNSGSHILCHPNNTKTVGQPPKITLTETKYNDDAAKNGEYLLMATTLCIQQTKTFKPIIQTTLTADNTTNAKNTNIKISSQQSPSLPSVSTNASPTITIQSPESPSNINNKSDHCLPETVPSLLQESLFNIMGAYDDAYAQNQKQETQTDIKIATYKQRQTATMFVCRFVECNGESFATKELFNFHNLKYHDVGLEFRCIAMAAEATQRTFPRVGLQCCYINCDKNLYFNSVSDVIHHLQSEHDEDLKEVMASKNTKKQNISTSYHAAKYTMLLGKIPLAFDDNVIYCCPFTKNEICTTKCFIDDSHALIQHLQSFHALHSDDAQFIINILRFIELKPVWRYWSKKKRRDRIHKRLDALLKYRGNVRKGFITKYKNQYIRRYLKTNKLNKVKSSENINVSILKNEDLFWEFKNCDNIGIDEEIFENIIHKTLVKKHGYEKQVNANANKRYRTGINENQYSSHWPSQPKRTRY